mmetsp:Transcript_7824/g.11673  ORF Transcript_7824/g.11673 Transcript_7824/m.11673 type:complete len:86 (+) Transcript_7824:52-309(+)
MHIHYYHHLSWNITTMTKKPFHSCNNVSKNDLPVSYRFQLVTMLHSFHVKYVQRKHAVLNTNAHTLLPPLIMEHNHDDEETISFL